MTKRFLLLCLLVLGLSLPVRAATGLSTAILTNFYGTHFLVTPNAPPTQVIKLKLFGGGVTIVTNTFTSVFNVFSNVTQEFNYTTNIIDNSVLIITNTTVIINGETNDLTQLWTNKSGVYEPTATNASTIAFGRSVDTWWVPSTADGFVNIHDQAQGESQFNTIALAAIDDAASTTNYALFTVNVAGGDLVSGQLRGVALTNWQDPNAPVSKFMVRLEPRFGEAEMILMNNGETNFWITNNVTSVEAMRWIPHTNDVLAAGAQNIDVAHYSHVALSATNTDPSLTDILLSAPIFDGTFLLLRNITDGQGFTLLNGSPLYDTPTAHVTLQGGTWVTTNAGDGLLLTGSPEGWSEVFRWTQNTNIQTSQLWELVSGHMRTVPNTVDDWQFRYGGVPQLTVGTNGGLAIGPNAVNFFGPPINGNVLTAANYTGAGDVNYNVISLETTDSLAETIAGQATLYTRTNTSALNIRAFDALADYSLVAGITLGATNPASLSFEEQFSGLGMFLSPGIADGAGSAAYSFGTVNTLSTRPILDLWNNNTNQLAFGPGPQIWFGEGGTNVLYRDENDLVYTNGNSDVKFTVQNGTGGQASVEAQGAVTAVLVGGNSVGLRAGSHQAFLSASGFSPVVDLHESLGGDATAWSALWSSNVYVRGFYNLQTNYSRLLISHSGTNSPVVLDSQSSGTAGNPRPIQLQFGGTNQWTFIPDGPAISAGITKAQKTAITPTNGMVVYQTDNTPGLRAYVNGAWVIISTAADP